MRLKQPYSIPLLAIHRWNRKCSHFWARAGTSGVPKWREISSCASSAVSFQGVPGPPREVCGTWQSVSRFWFTLGGSIRDYVHNLLHVFPGLHVSWLRNLMHVIFREDIKILTYKPHTNHKRSSVRSHTLAPTSIWDLSHSVYGESTDRSGSHQLSHLRLSSFVVCLWSAKWNFDVSPYIDRFLLLLYTVTHHLFCICYSTYNQFTGESDAGASMPLIIRFCPPAHRPHWPLSTLAQTASLNPTGWLFLKTV